MSDSLAPGCSANQRPRLHLLYPCLKVYATPRARATSESGCTGTNSDRYQHLLRFHTMRKAHPHTMTPLRDEGGVLRHHQRVCIGRSTRSTVGCGTRGALDAWWTEPCPAFFRTSALCGAVSLSRRKNAGRASLFDRPPGQTHHTVKRCPLTCPCDVSFLPVWLPFRPPLLRAPFRYQSEVVLADTLSRRRRGFGAGISLLWGPMTTVSIG